MLRVLRWLLDNQIGVAHFENGWWDHSVQSYPQVTLERAVARYERKPLDETVSGRGVKYRVTFANATTLTKAMLTFDLNTLSGEMV